MVFSNILLPADSSVLAQFENEELKEPSPRKEVDGVIIYQSRELGIPKDFGEPVLCDFGSAVALDDGVEHREDIQPNVYRSPEVILDIQWTYSVDIWNVGCMVSDYLLFSTRSCADSIGLGRFRRRAFVHWSRSRTQHIPRKSPSFGDDRTPWASSCWSSGKGESEEQVLLGFM